jgi:hypothetical protein
VNPAVPIPAPARLSIDTHQPREPSTWRRHRDCAQRSATVGRLSLSARVVVHRWTIAAASAAHFRRPASDPTAVGLEAEDEAAGKRHRLAAHVRTSGVAKDYRSRYRARFASEDVRPTA